MGRDSPPPPPQQPLMISSPSPSPPPPTALAPGFRFHPTDEELVWYYLRRKVTGKSFRFDAISETDIYKLEPWELPDKSRLKTRDLEWYFFSALDKKYGNGVRMNRATNKGYWKTTGKDRFVRHNSQIVGMKKTLVFHNGRAPGGERTNWVMHEYRLADDVSEKTGIPKDLFVLCRVFQKSGLGPPNGDRYAPFIEEEWDTDALVLVPGEEAGDEAVGDDNCVEGIALEQDGGQSVKMETSDEDCPPLCLAAPEPLPLFPTKRSQESQPNPASLASPEITSMSIPDRSSSTTTTATATPTPMMTTTTPITNLSSALLEFPLLDSIDRREGQLAAPPAFNSSNLTAFLPPACYKLFHELRNEIYNISAEKAAVKFELMSAQAMINALESQLYLLSKENEDLRRGCA